VQTDVINYYAGATFATPVQGLAVGVAYDYRGNSETDGWSSAYANAASLYLSFQATEKLKLNLRGEYASGTAGTWTLDKVGSGSNEEFIGITATADYSLWANVISRIEFRWDRDVSGGPAAFGGVGTTTLSDGDSGSGIGGITLPTAANSRDYERDAVSLALNVIYRF
jgi:hypothetical protein